MSDERTTAAADASDGTVATGDDTVPTDDDAVPTGDDATATPTVSTGADRRHLAATALGALVLALYAAWVTADLVPRWLVVPVVALVAGYVLRGKPTRRARIVYVCYALAVLLALTPVFVVLPDVLSAGTYGVGTFRLAFAIGKLVLVVPFALLAVVVAYVGYRANGGRGLRARASEVRS